MICLRMGTVGNMEEIKYRKEVIESNIEKMDEKWEGRRSTQT